MLWHIYRQHVWIILATFVWELVCIKAEFVVRKSNYMPQCYVKDDYLSMLLIPAWHMPALFFFSSTNLWNIKMKIEMFWNEKKKYLPMCMRSFTKQLALIRFSKGKGLNICCTPRTLPTQKLCLIINMGLSYTNKRQIELKLHALLINWQTSIIVSALKRKCCFVANDVNFFKMSIFLFQWYALLGHEFMLPGVSLRATCILFNNNGSYHCDVITMTPATMHHT